MKIKRLSTVDAFHLKSIIPFADIKWCYRSGQWNVHYSTALYMHKSVMNIKWYVNYIVWIFYRREIALLKRSCNIWIQNVVITDGWFDNFVSDNKQFRWVRSVKSSAKSSEYNTNKLWGFWEWLWLFRKIFLIDLNINMYHIIHIQHSLVEIRRHILKH